MNCSDYILRTICRRGGATDGQAVGYVPKITDLSSSSHSRDEVRQLRRLVPILLEPAAERDLEHRDPGLGVRLAAGSGTPRWRNAAAIAAARQPALGASRCPHAASMRASFAQRLSRHDRAIVARSHGGGGRIMLL